MKTENENNCTAGNDFRERMRGVMSLDELMPENDCDLRLSLIHI